MVWYSGAGVDLELDLLVLEIGIIQLNYKIKVRVYKECWHFSSRNLRRIENKLVLVAFGQVLVKFEQVYLFIQNSQTNLILYRHLR